IGGGAGVTKQAICGGRLQGGVEDLRQLLSTAVLSSFLRSCLQITTPNGSHFRVEGNTTAARFPGQFLLKGLGFLFRDQLRPDGSYDGVTDPVGLWPVGEQSQRTCSKFLLSFGASYVLHYIRGLTSGWER